MKREASIFDLVCALIGCVGIDKRKFGSSCHLLDDIISRRHWKHVISCQEKHYRLVLNYLNYTMTHAGLQTHESDNRGNCSILTSLYLWFGASRQHDVWSICVIRTHATSFCAEDTQFVRVVVVVQGFDHHINHEHNIWAYIFFFIHLNDTKQCDYTSLELFVYRLVGCFIASCTDYWACAVQRGYLWHHLLYSPWLLPHFLPSVMQAWLSAECLWRAVSVKCFSRV